MDKKDEILHMIYYQLLDVRNPYLRELRNRAINICKIKENRKLKEKRPVKGMRRELEEAKAKIEELIDKEYEQHNLQLSSQVIYKSFVNLNVLRIKIDHVQMYVEEFHLADKNLIKKL